MDILQAQKHRVLQMLNLNESVDDDDTFNEHKTTQNNVVWKLIVYDRYCERILSPLITVGETRKFGITLHLLMNSPRERVPDVAAIYFIQPVQKNIERIAKDCASGVYDEIHLNVSSFLPRKLLEDLALKTLESGSVNKVSRIMDQYLSFISLSKHLFTMNVYNSYARLNANEDNVVMACCDEIVESLFSVLVTLGVVPVICTRKGQAAELIARKLDSLLRSRANLFQEGSSSAFKRPLLILVDRNVDLQAPLHHSWTYQALAHDLLTLQSNRVSFQLTDPETHKVSNHEYDVGASDEFWSANASTLFPDIAETAIPLLGAEYKQLRTRHGIGGDTNPSENNASAGDIRDNLASVIDSVPELQHKKRLVDAHTNIGMAMMRAITDRELDEFFSLEDRMTASGLFPDVSRLITRLQPNAKGTSDDKLRLLLIYYLTRDSIPTDELNQLQAAVTESGANTEALQYLTKVRMMHRIATGQHDTASTTSTKSSAAAIVDSAAVKNIFGYIKGNVKNLLPVKHKLPLTRIVRALMEGSNPASLGAGVKSEYVYFDARSQSKNIAGVAASDAIVVMCGGGSFMEMENLISWAKDVSKNTMAPPTRIIYGATDMTSPSDMLRQLESLAHANNKNLQ